MNDSAYPDLAKVEDWLNGRGYTGEAGSCHAAMDEIRQLRADNERLRAALKPFADIAKQTEHWSGPPVSVPLYVIRAAAAALKETGDE